MPAKHKLNHTKLGIFLLVPAIIFMIYISIRHWSEDEWGSFAFFYQLLPGVVGLIGYQLLKKEPIFPTQYAEIDNDFIMRVGIMVVGVAIVQIIAQITISITDLEYAFYVSFAAPLEEIFHRAFVITAIVMVLSLISDKLKNVWRIVAVIISSVIFTSLHFSYYGNWSVLTGVFLSGVVLGLGFAFWEDITANIMAHFLWNFCSILISNLSNTIVWVSLVVVFAALIAISFIGKKKKNVRIQRYNVKVSSGRYRKIKR